MNIVLLNAAIVRTVTELRLKPSTHIDENRELTRRICFLARFSFRHVVLVRITASARGEFIFAFNLELRNGKTLKGRGLTGGVGSIGVVDFSLGDFSIILWSSCSKAFAACSAL